MSLYKFSPINDAAQLDQALEYVAQQPDYLVAAEERA